MRTSTTAVAFLVMLSGAGWGPHGPAGLLPVADSAHTLFQPNAPAAGQAGRPVQLPQGGTGVTTGGTPYYQTYGAPGGGGVAVPNGNMSTVTGSGGRTGVATTPH